MNNSVTQRLVEMTFAPLDEVAGWLTRLGLEIVRREEGVVAVRNPHLNLTTAILEKSDPTTRAVCLGFAVAGVFWPHVFPRLLHEVNKAWQTQYKQQDPQAGGQGKSPPGPGNFSVPRESHPAMPTFAEIFKK